MRPRLRRIAFRSAAILVPLVLGLLAVEAAVRSLDGYAVWAWSLERTGMPPEETEGDPAELKERVLAFLAAGAAAARPDVDPEWLLTAPPPFERPPALEELETRARSWQDGSINYVLNEAQVDADLRGEAGPLRDLIGRLRGREVFVASWPGESRRPVYRYFPRVTLPTGLSTNALGWRGPELSVAKPAATVRIVCVGASTTADSHHLRASYPEFLGHWLGLWAARRGLPIRFEVLNAGREGIGPEDIEGVVRHEVLPLVPDFVVYYEGINRFEAAKAIRLEGGPAGAPPEWIPSLVPSAGAESGWLAACARRSAVAARLRAARERPPSGREPPKPAQALALPEGLDEADPDPAKARPILYLGAIQDALDGMRRDLDAAGARLVMTTFCLLVENGLELDPSLRAGIFAYLNRRLWPVSYAHLRRLMDLQNRVFRRWARDHGVDLVEVADRLPLSANLYIDGVHHTEVGVRMKAWCVFDGLVPLLERDLAAGRIPLPPKSGPVDHPNLQPFRRRTLPR